MELIEQLSLASTFNTFSAQRLENKQPTIADQTWLKYKKDLENHILPHIGKKRLNEVGEQDSQNQFYKTLAEVVASARYHAFKTLGFVMATAHSEGVIEKNYLRAVPTPTHQTVVKSDDESHTTSTTPGS